ncbi:MAG TPA: CusA/CzcA family heavy metal efflux RND transporter [Planctomycetota bacterium]|nr:CusA/CzcA family heavy metal efflux RND transporter [Planctomycetota bacterium]
MIAALVRFALTQRILVLVVGVTLALAGVWAFGRLPIDAFPDISVPQVQIIVKVPGLSPVEVEQRITLPIETELRGIERQTMMRSMTKYALSVVTLDFEEGTDIYWARQQVSERWGAVRDSLPPGTEGSLAPITTPLGEVFMFTLEGQGYTNRQLRSILDWNIRPRLLPVAGVADVNALGGEVRSMEVQVRPEALQAHALTLDDVVHAIESNNRNAGGDRIVRNDEVLLVRTVGRLLDLEDLRNVPVANRDGVTLRVGDVAQVAEGALTRYGGVTKDGKGEHVQGLVLTRLGANSRDTVERVKAVLSELAPSLPPGVRVVPFYDRTELVRQAVTMVRDALAMASLLVVAVLLLFMGDLRGSLVAALILPLTVLGTFVGMYFLGLKANLMSLGGLAIAIGILVDPAVVVVENMQTYLARARRGVGRLHQIYRAVLEVGSPVVSGTAIIVIVFLPILSLSGLEGRMFGPLAETIALALVVAVLLSLVCLPVVGSFVLRAGGQEDNGLLRMLKRAHKPAVEWALARPRRIALGLVGLMVPAGWVFAHIGGEFIPTLQEGTMVVQTTKLPSISLAKSLEIDGRIQRALLEQPEVLHVVSRLGSDELRLDPMGLGETDHYLVTKPKAEWGVQDGEHLERALRERLARIPGVAFGFTQPIEMRTSEMITGVTSALAIKVFGHDLDELDQLSAQVEQVVAATPGAVDVKRGRLSGQTYLEIQMDHAAMARFGVGVETINALMETAVAGRVVTEMIDGSQRIGVVVRYPEAERNTVAALERLRVPTAQGQAVPLASLAQVVELDGPVVLEHEQSMRHVVLEANVEGRDIVGLVEELRQRIANEVPMPPGYYVEYGGQFENQARASQRLALVVPVALALVFLILFSTFRSLRQAGLILFNIPVALIGGVFALSWSGLYMSVPASVGFIALFGTALLNGIVMFTYFNQLRDGGASLDEAVRLGASRRLRPVLMTAVTTGLGLVPLLLATGPGSEVQRPLAIVVMGGLFTSTLVTLVVLPSLYAWWERSAAKTKASQTSPLVDLP